MPARAVRGQESPTSSEGRANQASDGGISEKRLKCAVQEKRSKDINLPSQAEKTAQNAPQSAETAKEAQASSEETPKSENKGILSKASFEFSEFDLDALKMVGAMFHGVKCKVRIEVETDG